ncbi:MAG: DUF234 domain-containing protein [Gaiellales bacterium]
MKTVHFVNRERELLALGGWWDAPGSSLALVWGRRRVGKTALLQEFAAGRRVVYHTAAGRPVQDELRLLARATAPAIRGGLRDLEARPFADWDDAFETLAQLGERERLLVVIDEFPELVATSAGLEGTLRAVWDRVRDASKLKLLLSGSSFRTMEAIQEARAPLYGRIDLVLQLRPFAPHEAALMLPGLEATEQALVWGLLGGVPLYLEWWDAAASLEANLERLVCTPGGPLLTAGELTLATDADAGELARQTLYAIAAGRTKHNEVADAIRADPTRVLERLTTLGLIERVAPVTEDPRRTRRRLYRIADNFLAFWLRIVDRYRAEIERGLGHSILPVLVADLDDHLGPRWEEAFRVHLRRLAEAGEIGPDIVAVGSFWTATVPPVEIDAVALAGRGRAPVLAGEAKWTRTVDAAPIVQELQRKSAALPGAPTTLRFAVGARERVENPGDALTVTAEEVFGP